MYYTKKPTPLIIDLVLQINYEYELEDNMKTSVIGFPRIGTLRELKFASEKYFKKEITADELLE